VALEAIFQNTATELDAAIIEGMNAAIASGLAWAAPQLRVALGLYVIGNAMMMMYGKMDGSAFLHAVVRAMAVAAILKATNYNYFVRDLFFIDLPNEMARAMNGPRVTVNSAQQFDVLWSAVAHYTAFIKGQATGLSNMGNVAVVFALAGLNLGALWGIFGIWLISRVFMALVICLGPFLIILYLFRGTREYVNQWIGKLVGLTVLQLAASILLRILLVILSSRLMAINQNPGLSVDEMIVNAASVTGVFWLGALMMIVLPAFLAIHGVSAAASIAAGVGAMAGGAAKGVVVGSAKLGKRLGEYTGRQK
jgi:type IV secretory pathway VirB6-like protein